MHPYQGWGLAPRTAGPQNAPLSRIVVLSTQTMHLYQGWGLAPREAVQLMHPYQRSRPSRRGPRRRKPTRTRIHSIVGSGRPAGRPRQDPNHQILVLIRFFDEKVGTRESVPHYRRKHYWRRPAGAPRSPNCAPLSGIGAAPLAAAIHDRGLQIGPRGPPQSIRNHRILVLLRLA